MKNLTILVEEVGGALEHVCKVTTYLLDRARREPFYNTVAPPAGRRALRHRAYRLRPCDGGHAR
jgi:hypothetical protein